MQIIKLTAFFQAVFLNLGSRVKRSQMKEDKCSNAPAKNVKNAQKSLIDREKKTLQSQASLLGKPGALIVFLRGVEASPAS